MAEDQAVARKEGRSTGKVTSFKKSFGFIKPDDGGDDLFVHQSEIRSDGGYRSLADGDIVEFNIALSGDNKYQAINVIATGGAPIGSSSRRSGAYGSSWTGAPRRGYGSGCYNCGSPGHLARDCASNVGGGGGACFKCGDAGHFVRDCPQSGNGGGDFGASRGSGCYQCGGFGHMARDCPTGGGGGCYNCGGIGHLARDCSSARVGGRFTGGGTGGGRGCFQCGKEGHFARECPNAA